MTEDITQLINSINEILKRYEEVAQISGENFNVFKITDLTTDEVKLHSAFIAELLNPNGSHGQKHVFLNLFIEMLNEELKNNLYDSRNEDPKIETIKFCTTNANVFTEKYIGQISEDNTQGGTIDILIENDKGEKIIIENKIYATDQPNQLLRYHNFHSKNLFYLNLHGTEPDPKSYGKLKIDHDFKIISYKQNIITWLEKCKKEVVDLPLIREGINHYINILKYLTGQSNNKNMEDDIRNTITSSFKNLKTAYQISNSFTDAKIQIQHLFWKFLREEYENKGLPLYKDTVTWQKIRSYYEYKRNREKHIGLWSKVYEKENITVHFGIEVNWNVYYGFTIEVNGKGGISDNAEYNEIRDFLYKELENYTNDNWYKKHWLAYKYTNPKLDFYNFKTDAIFNLADREILKRTVADIVENSMNDIDIFKTQLIDFFN